MILRHSLSSVRRTPWKSLLFSGLILILSLVVTLGGTMLYSCLALLNQSRTDYVTTAVLDYQGGKYPDSETIDGTARSLHESIDFDAIEALDFVREVDRQKTAAAYISGIRIPSVLSLTGAITVVDVTVFATYGIGLDERYLSQMSEDEQEMWRIRMEQEDPSVRAEVNQVLCGDAMKKGQQINLSPDCWETVTVDTASGPAIVDVVKYHGTVPEKGHRYLVCLRDGGVSQGMVSLRRFRVLEAYGGDYNDLVIPAAAALGETIEDPICEIPLEGPDPDAPGARRFFHLIEAAEKMDHCLYTLAVEDPAFLPEFSQGEYGIVEGELYGPADLADGTICCLFPKRYADQLELHAGDEISMELLSAREPIGSNYWPGCETSEVTCKVAGIYDCSTEILPRIYLSNFPTGFQAAGPVGYTLGNLRLRSGTTRAELDRLRSLLPEEVTLTVYDQGFANLESAMEEMKLEALTLLGVCLLAGLVLLTVFARVFVGRQEESLETMRMMGTPGRKRAAYILISTGVLLLLSAGAGGVLALRFSELPNRVLQRSVAGLDRSILRYSNLSLGVTRTVSAAVKMPWQLIAVCAGSVVLLGWVLCLLRLRRMGRPVRERSARALAPRDSARISGAGRKYLLLSIGRNKLRSSLILCLIAVMVCFVVLLNGALEAYRQQRKNLDRDTVIRGYLTSYNGRSRYRLNLIQGELEELEHSGLFEDLTLICGDAISSGPTLAQKSDGTPGEAFDWETKPQTEAELFQFSTSGLTDGNQLIYLRDLGAAPEFGGKMPTVRWLEGYDEGWFAGTEGLTGLRLVMEYGQKGIWSFQEDRRELCCVASSGFLDQLGAELGDTLAMELMVPIPPPSEYMANAGDYLAAAAQNPVVVKYKIIGVYEGDSDRSNLYTRFANHPKTVGKWAAIRSRFSAAAFTLRDPARLQEAKDWLWDNNFSLVNQARRLRIFPILEDRDYLNAASRLDRNVAYLRVLLPVLTVLALLGGFASALLLLGRRLQEITTLRQLGMSRLRTFGVFWTEQLLLCLGGVLLALVVSLLLRRNWRLPQALAFPAGYLAGSAGAILRLLRGKLSELLHEKE